METLFTGKNFLELPEAASTQEVAAALLAQSPPEGTLVTTANQTAGRGQRGAQWLSEPGKNLAFSLIYYPQFLAPAAVFHLSRAAVLGLMDAFRHFLPQAEILAKWPNDVLIGGKKVSGILIDNHLESTRIRSSIWGIGVNVNQTEFPGRGYGRATSLALENGAPLEPETVLARILSCLEARYLALRAGKTAALEQEYLHRLWAYQETVQVQVDGEILSAVFVGVDQSGRAALDIGGKLRYFGIKEISFLR